MNPHAHRHQQQQLIRDERIETGPLPDDWCVMCNGQGGWHVTTLLIDTVETIQEWEVCIYCKRGPDDPDPTYTPNQTPETRREAT